ncbi:MAG: transporter, partial [Bryobacterales bacterium]|nr:transporter [Bryobacterales bacterium]
VPARQSFLVEMVGREDMINAIALNSTMFNFARVAGPAVAGILVARIGEGWCFFANGISYIAVITGLLLMKLDPAAPRPPRTGSVLRNIRDGYAFIGRNPPIRNLLGMTALLSFAGLSFIVLMPVFADGILHKGAGGLGALMSSLGVGATVAALLLASRVNVAGLSKWLSGAALTLPISLTAFAASTRLPLSMVLMLVAGFAMMIQIGATNTLIQSMVPDSYRGRVMSVYSMMLIGMNPLGAIAAGFAAHRWGAQITLTVGALACLVAAIAFALRLPHFRLAARLLIDEEARLTSPPDPVELPVPGL